jgi:ankyrin repeat protein
VPFPGALINACKDGNLSIVKSLVRKGDIKKSLTEEYQGCSSIHWAARQGHTDIVMFLIEAGEVVRVQLQGIQDSSQRTALD